MKILKISTHPYGGAFIAGERQARALRHLGHDVKHLCVGESWEKSPAFIEESRDRVFCQGQKTAQVQNDILFQALLDQRRTSVSNTYMSAWNQESIYDLLIGDYIHSWSPDIVHFHWASNLVSSRLLQRLKADRRRVFFTCHDLNYFTGGCHYNAGCDQYQFSCEQCHMVSATIAPVIQLNLAMKLSSLKEPNFQFIFPSEWLKSLFDESALATGQRSPTSHVVRNCLDTKFFSPITAPEQQKLRIELGVSPEEIMIISGAQNNGEIRKGFDLLEATLQKTRFSAHSGRVHILTFGENAKRMNIPSKSFVQHNLGTVSESRIRDLLRVADFLFFTSVEENFSNLILESVNCGCPVVAFAIGGVPEGVFHEENGLLIDRVSADEAALSVQSLIVDQNKLSRLKRSAVAWRDLNHARFSESAIGSQLLALYERRL